MPQNQRQGALPDAAEADENDPAGKLNVYLVIGHDAPESSEVHLRACHSSRHRKRPQNRRGRGRAAYQPNASAATFAEGFSGRVFSPVRRVGLFVAGQCFDAFDPARQRRVIHVKRQEARRQLLRLRLGERPQEKSAGSGKMTMSAAERLSPTTQCGLRRAASRWSVPSLATTVHRLRRAHRARRLTGLAQKKAFTIFIDVLFARTPGIRRSPA